MRFLRVIIIVTLLGTGLFGFLLLPGHDPMTRGPVADTACEGARASVTGILAEAKVGTPEHRLSWYDQMDNQELGRRGQAIIDAHPTCFH